MNQEESRGMATTTTLTTRTSDSVFGGLQIAITILVAATALIHLFLGVTLIVTLTGPTPQDAGIGEPLAAILAVLFVCNFGGYIVLGVAHYLPALRRFQRITRAGLISFATLAFVGYFVVDHSQLINPIGLGDKVVELALIGLLVIEGRRARA